jgi:hypothetical protein
VTTPGPGITVITTPGNTYTIAAGATQESEPTVTGELSAEVFDASGNWLANFGSVETIYVTGAVVQVTPASKTL